MKLFFSCLMVLMFFSLIFSAYAQVSIGNEIGTANLDKDRISVSRHFDEHVKIYGTILEAERGTKVTIHITDPNGDLDPSSQQVFTTDVGYFETFKILNWESLRGTYTILVSSNNKIIGSLLFVVQESDEHPANIQTQKQITYDTVLTLEITSSQDSIRVFPKYTDNSGNELSFIVSGNEEFIEIYIDNQYVKSVKPNQWSDDITVGYGSHDAYAESPEFTITGSGDTYLSAQSNSQSISLPDYYDDRILDSLDSCPTQPETFNGYEDSDGCPDVVPPPTDTDGDSIPDSIDACPTQPETFNGYDDYDGCPDVVLTLSVERGANPDSIQVFPKYTDNSGNELSFIVNNSEEFIEIYIDDQYVKSVKPNQWSEDITAGYGSHDAYAKSPEYTITGSGDRYLSAQSNTQGIYLQQSTVSSGTQDQSGFIALVIIAVIGIVVGVIIMKRRKPSTIPGGTQTDDTQIWR